MSEETEENYRSCDDVEQSGSGNEAGDLFLTTAPTRPKSSNIPLVRGQSTLPDQVLPVQCNGINISLLHPHFPREDGTASEMTSAMTSRLNSATSKAAEASIAIPLFLPMDKAFEAKYATKSKKRGKSFKEKTYLFLEHPSGWIGFLYHFSVYVFRKQRDLNATVAETEKSIKKFNSIFQIYGGFNMSDLQCFVNNTKV